MNTRLDVGWRDNRRGALAMAGAMALIIVNDAMIKLASETLPAAETIAIRGAFATLWILLALLATGQGRQIHHCIERRTLWRGVLDVASTFSYLLALFRMPLAEATAINMAAPLIMVMFAVVFLRENVRWQRWAAVLAGFAGMLLVVRPGGSSFTSWAGLCFAGTVLNAARDVYTRRISNRVPSLVITFTTASAVTVASVVITMLQGWQPVAAKEALLLAGASGFLAGAYYLMIVAMRLGEASVVGGFRYSGLPAAALLGWAVWGYLPDAVSITGMAVLVAAGLYLLNHERGAALRRSPA